MTYTCIQIYDQKQMRTNVLFDMLVTARRKRRIMGSHLNSTKNPRPMPLVTLLVAVSVAMVAYAAKSWKPSFAAK